MNDRDIARIEETFARMEESVMAEDRETTSSMCRYGVPLKKGENKAEKVPKLEQQKTMTPGQAIDWMWAHQEGPRERIKPWQKLLGSDDRLYWVDATGGIVCGPSSVLGGTCRVGLDKLLNLTFTIPPRELPKLPDGWEWSLSSGLAMASKVGGSRHLRLANRVERNIYAALVEEFDTRPNGEL